MKRSLLTYFAWISLALAALTACRSGSVIYSGNVSTEKMTFKTTVTWGESELSGLLLVKVDENGDLRVAFMNELGMTYLEGTMNHSTRRRKLVINNIAPIIDYKPFIKNFENCLSVAFKHEPGISAIPGQVELRNGFRLNLTIIL